MELSLPATKGQSFATHNATLLKTKYEVKKSIDSPKISKKEENVETSKSSKFSFKKNKMEGGLNLPNSSSYLYQVTRAGQQEYDSIDKCFVFKDKVMYLALQEVVLLEEDKVSANQVTTTLVIVNPKEVKIPKDFWIRKLEPGKLWGDYSSDSDGEDSERPYHMYVEVDDAQVIDEKKPHTLQVEKKGPQAFFVIFTNEYLPEEDLEHNWLLYVSLYASEVRITWILVDGGSAVNI
ncbi:hypothetical protein LIER_05223 [Lithospermum erythrorhizon]|uniref:Uncharacterized protein n=1 Tax=Lithospermum erythrorhizon TaxID=34254 RepID=A0AAV3P1B9_LITER